MNRLGEESSPYLRQHMHNPVHWLPWGGEAFARAKAEDRPILLSVGYAACHWCHVMERESFESEDTAGLMNRLFVCVKVDREERPDVDNVYQTAVQLLRQSGGWPLTAFLLPDGRCFHAGTYFPDEPRHGMPSFRMVLEQVATVYRERRADVERAAAGLVDGLVRVQTVGGTGDFPRAELCEEAAEFLLSRIDTTHGGFEGRPKFPSPSNLWTLWRHGLSGQGPSAEACRDAVLFTLRKMADGGIHDQFGGGFHRYSTDEEWLAPHFEKMLYDNAQLVPLYLDAWRFTRLGEYLRVATGTLDYLLREMCAPDGAFYGTTDADSEGEEGRFFVWTPRGVAVVLGDEEIAPGRSLAEAVCAAYDITEGGNWEGHSIPRRIHDFSELAREFGVGVEAFATALDGARARLLEARGRRVPPLRDEKVLASWNGLAIAAFVDGWEATGNESWLRAGQRAAGALLDSMVRDGRLAHSRCAFPDGQVDVRGPGLLDDHAAFGEALLRLFEADGDRHWLNAATALAHDLWYDFRDSATGGWFQTPASGERLVTRPRDVHDSAVPSGSALAAAFLHRLSVHLPGERWGMAVEATLAAHASQLDRNPFGSGHMLGVLDGWCRGFAEVVVGGEGEGRARLLTVARRTAVADRVVLALERLPPGHPAAAGRGAVEPTAWVCRGRSCSLPVRDPERLRDLLVSPG
jgi:uncharacterized protein YyaL (SSP411 family)